MNELLTTNRMKILEIATMHGAHCVRVFGSFAKDQECPQSDIDLLVDMDTDRSLIDIIAIKHEVEDLTNRSVDVVTEAALSPYLRNEVLAEAVML